MFCVSGFPQVSDDVVRMDIDGHSGEKDEGADDKLRRGEPCVRIVVFRSEVKNPSALHAGVQDVEYDTHDDDSDWHGAVSLEQERVDERAVQVV